MQPLKSITIPQPCHQNWNEMTPVEQGRHCAHCSKTVTDFTAMTNSQIVSYLAQRSNVCGRFDNYQLAGLNNMCAVQETPKFSWKRLAIAAAITSFFATTKAEAQRTVGKVAVTQSVNNPKAILIGDTITYTTIKGKIIADDDNKPLPGVAVVVKGTTIGTQTNANGEFNLYVPSNAKSLSISYIGFQSYEASISDFIEGSKCVTLKTTPGMMGEVVIIKKVPFYKRWWHKIKRVF